MILYIDSDKFFIKTEALLVVATEISKINKKYKIDSNTEQTSNIAVEDDLRLLTASEIEFLSPVCVICYQNLIEEEIDPNTKNVANESHHSLIDQVLYLLCCSSFVHENHLFDWTQRRRSCPYCKYQNPQTDRVQITI